MNMRILYSTLLTLALAVGPARAGWYVAQNPLTGGAEAVWLDAGSGGSSADVLYAYLEGSSWTASTLLSPIGKASSGPVLAFDAEGRRHVVFATDEAVGRIVMRSQAPSGGPWGGDVVVSDSTESATNPDIVCESDILVAYETLLATGGRGIRVSKIDDNGGIDRSIIAESARNGSVQVRLHAEAGWAWVDWVDSDAMLGYAVRDGVRWSGGRYEAYAGPDDVKAGRERIREAVVNGEGAR